MALWGTMTLGLVLPLAPMEACAGEHQVRLLPASLPGFFPPEPSQVWLLNKERWGLARSRENLAFQADSLFPGLSEMDGFFNAGHPTSSFRRLNNDTFPKLTNGLK